MKVKQRRAVVWVLLGTATLVGCASQAPDSLQPVEQINASGTPHASRPASEFLVHQIDASLKAYEEGQLAAERANSLQVREIGRQMMCDQIDLLAQMDRIALSTSVTVPVEIGREDRNRLEALRRAPGDNFDDIILRTVRIEHERSIREYEAAETFDEAAVRSFAVERLPTLRTTLARVEAVGRLE